VPLETCPRLIFFAFFESIQVVPLGGERRGGEKEKVQEGGERGRERKKRDTSPTHTHTPRCSYPFHWSYGNGKREKKKMSKKKGGGKRGICMGRRGKRGGEKGKKSYLGGGEEEKREKVDSKLGLP